MSKIQRKGSGLLNNLINKLPAELHLPGYQFCGPGTDLRKRLLRGDKGINSLDAACREHDIAYSQSEELDKRHIADNILFKNALNRVTAKDATLKERIAALGVAGAMKVKTKFGMGYKNNNKRKNKKKNYRQLPVAKYGGFLPLLPALAALGAIGSVAGGAAGIAKTINAISSNKKQLEEFQRHNKFMEGRGFYLKPYKKGSGLKRKRNKKNKKSNK